MCDQTFPYSFGTPVWAYVLNRIWWPCRVVDPNTAPKQMQDLMLKNKNSIALLHFEGKGKFEIIVDMKKVYVYDCPRKMEFLERGYEMYIKQKKSLTIKSVDMDNFVNDVVSVEKEISGDVNIFNDLEKKINEVISKKNHKQLIKKLFVSSKDVKKKKVGKKTFLKTKKTNKIPLKTEAEVNEATTSQTNPIPSSQTNQDISGVPTEDLTSKLIFVTKYVCRMSKICSFITDSGELAKQHIRDHRKNGELATVHKATTNMLLNNSKYKVDTKALPRTQKKRKSTCTNKRQPKMTKVHRELFKDLVDRDEDENEGAVTDSRDYRDSFFFKILSSKLEIETFIEFDKLCCDFILNDKVEESLKYYFSLNDTDSDDLESDSQPDEQHGTRFLDLLSATALNEDKNVRHINHEETLGLERSNSLRKRVFKSAK